MTRDDSSDAPIARAVKPVWRWLRRHFSLRRRSGAGFERARDAQNAKIGADDRLDHMISVDGLRLYAVERGVGADRNQQRAIILIHGAGLDHRDWTFNFWDGLPRAWRVIAVDRPGFGGSERARNPGAALPASQAATLRRAVARIGVREAVLVGHSWGGAVAMAWALDAPEHVLGVASLAGAIEPWSFATTLRNGKRIQAAALTSLAGGGLRQAARDGVAESFAPNPAPPGYLDHMRTELSLFSGPTAAMMADIAAINSALALMAPRYPTLTRPVELIYGAADQILDVNEQSRAAQLLPQARLTVIPSVGHMPHHVEPHICLTAIERLCATV